MLMYVYMFLLWSAQLLSMSALKFPSTASVLTECKERDKISRRIK